MARPRDLHQTEGVVNHGWSPVSRTGSTSSCSGPPQILRSPSPSVLSFPFLPPVTGVPLPRPPASPTLSATDGSLTVYRGPGPRVPLQETVGTPTHPTTVTGSTRNRIDEIRTPVRGGSIFPLPDEDGHVRSPSTTSRRFTPVRVLAGDVADEGEEVETG